MLLISHSYFCVKSVSVWGGNSDAIPHLHSKRNSSMCSSAMLAQLRVWRNKCWFMEQPFKNNSLQVCIQALKLAQMLWMTYWITRSSPQNISAVIIIWDCTLWKRYDPQCCIAFSWSASVIEYRPSLNWEERIGVCLIMEQSGDGFAVCWWWFLCSFFKKRMSWGRDGLLLINRL